MEARLRALLGLLNALNVDLDIETVRDRKLLQKAVYLGQLSGVDLGYRFGWYLMGPYSPALTKDYYEAADQLEAGYPAGSRSLNEALVEKINAIKPLFEPPKDGPDKTGWLELLASYHFLRKESKKRETEVAAIIGEQKPQLSKYVSRAKAALRERELV